jgi:hypothetical protein
MHDTTCMPKFVQISTVHWAFTVQFCCHVCRIQQNSFNLTSNSGEILLVWRLRRVVLRMEVLLFTREKTSSSEMGRSQGHILKGLQEYLYIYHCGISWPLRSHSINFLSFEDLKNHRRGPWWPWNSRWKRYANGILLWLVVEPEDRSSNKNLPVRT